MSHGSQVKRDGFTATGSVEHERRKAVERVLFEGNDVLAALEEGERPPTGKLDEALKALAGAFGVVDKMKKARDAFNRAAALAATIYEGAYKRDAPGARDAYIDAVNRAGRRYRLAMERARGASGSP